MFQNNKVDDVDFSKPICRECRSFDTILGELAEKFELWFAVSKADIDRINCSESYEIPSVPQ